MDDFCKACSIRLFGEDFEDLKGLCGKSFYASTICEGCGYIQVNYLGECVSPDCSQQGKEGHGVE